MVAESLLFVMGQLSTGIIVGSVYRSRGNLSRTLAVLVAYQDFGAASVFRSSRPDEKPARLWHIRTKSRRKRVRPTLAVDQAQRRPNKKGVPAGHPPI
jgi:hypothetical protein